MSQSVVKDAQEYANGWETHQTRPFEKLNAIHIMAQGFKAWVWDRTGRGAQNMELTTIHQENLGEN